MPCSSCLSSNHAEFSAEVNIHFRGFKNLNKPAVLAFPMILVCLDCGASRFTLPENELAQLAETDEAATGAAA